jgi:hypothetical protein
VTTTSAATIGAGTSSPTKARTAVYSTTGTTSISQSGVTYGQSNTSSTSGQNYTSAYQKTTGTSELGTGTVTTGGSSYTFQTKKY